MKKYSKIGQFKSKGRIFNESSSKYRSPFQRDRDRIIHSASFRRLKHKTQVFVNTEGDHFRTRITHSMEVAQIARSIARYLNLNEDLAECLSLAHDLGHTPFGHAGEDSLDECMENYGGFDHNLQTLRIVMFLENKYLRFNGLNLSIETLEGLLKHNGPVDDISLVDNLIGIKKFKNMINFNTYPSIEAQISAISDDIAYNNHDIQDGIKANLFSLEELVEIKFFRDIHKKYKNKNLYESLKAYGVGHHRHNSEIDQMLKKFTKKKIEVSFTPHLSPMFRGILSTIYLDLNKNVNQSKIISLLSKFYKKEKFIKISKSDTLISTNDVINTNNCLISVCKSKFKNKIIILSAIDNLIKGGAGQAVQSLNNRFNFPETTGLI